MIPYSRLFSQSVAMVHQQNAKNSIKHNKTQGHHCMMERTHTRHLSRQSSEWRNSNLKHDYSEIVDNSQEFAKASIEYNRSIRILGIIASIGIIMAFSPSVYRFIEQGKWLSNPIAGTVEHPAQTVLSYHSLSALFWTLLCTLQVTLGSFITNSGQTWFGRKFHILMGRYILPFIILFMNITALMILFDETSKKRLHISITILNVQAVVFIISWSCLGYYYIFKKQYLKHKDCMISVFLSTFVPGLYRLVRYPFQIIYYIIYSEYCLDVNKFAYLIIAHIIVILLCGITMGNRKRLTLKQPHNLIFFGGLCFGLFLSVFTMKDDFNPCHVVNTPDSKFGVVID